MRDPVVTEVLTKVFVSHLYTCDQSTDPCFHAGRRMDIAGGPVETWREAAERVGRHLAEVVADAIREDGPSPIHLAPPRYGPR